jgi:hypothetical protein
MSERWSKELEHEYDGWSRQYATDILWQAGAGAVFSVGIGLGGPALGLSPVIAIFGVLLGATTVFSLRKLMNARRRRQFLASRRSTVDQLQDRGEHLVG